MEFFFGDVEIWKTHRTFWKKNTFKQTMTLLQGPKDPVLPTLVFPQCQMSPMSKQMCCKRFMHELFSMPIMNDHYSIQICRIDLHTIYCNRVNNQFALSTIVWSTRMTCPFFKDGIWYFFLFHCKFKVQIDNLKSQVRTY